jgi:hypothetical protein
MPTFFWKSRTARWVSRPTRPSLPSGVEAELGEAELQFLHLGERHQPFATWKWMHERTIAADAVGEMYDREDVGKCWVVAHHGGEILSDQKCRAAFDRHRQLGLVVRPREG